MNDYHAVETLSRLKMQDIQREAAMARLAAQTALSSRARYRVRLARSLYAFARRIDPSYEPTVGRTPLAAVSR